jgi:ascorbate-specific PTS system EIIC-type component UlaA
MINYIYNIINILVQRVTEISTLILTGNETRQEQQLF